MSLSMQPWFQAPRSRTLSLLGSGILLLGAGLPGFGEAGATPVLIRSEEPGWAQFRGPYRDGVSQEKGLLKSWPSGGPSRLWTTTNLGRGFSSPVISDGRVILTGDKGRHLEIQALDLQGRSLWRTTNGTSWTSDYPGARASVTLSAGKVYHMNAHGRLVCLEAATGRELWTLPVVEQYEGSNITWGLSECVLVDSKAVYVTVGGKQALLVALDKTNGNLIWKTPALHDSAGEKSLESASYVSPILLQYGSRRLIVGCSLRHLYCVDADTGALQWTQEVRTRYSVLAMMPALVNDGVFMTAPHGHPGRFWRLGLSSGLVSAAEVWQTKLDTCQGGVVNVDGKLFGSFYPGRKGWAALDARTGNTLYQLEDVVKGSILSADSRLYAYCEDGWVLLWEAGEGAFIERGRFRFAHVQERDAWAHPVVLDGRLYLRYHDELACFDVRARP